MYHAIWQAFARLHWREFIVVGVVQFLFNGVSTAGMLAMRELIEYVQDDQTCTFAFTPMYPLL